MRSLCYEYQFSFLLKLELITMTKISQLGSLRKRGWEELGNSLFLTLPSLRESSRELGFSPFSHRDYSLSTGYLMYCRFIPVSKTHALSLHWSSIVGWQPAFVLRKKKNIDPTTEIPLKLNAPRVLVLPACRVSPESRATCRLLADFKLT